MGNAYFHLSEPEKAIEYFEQALKIAQEIGDRLTEGTSPWESGERILSSERAEKSN